MWLVCIDRDFYPVVEEFDTEDKAIERYHELEKELTDDIRSYKTKLYIASVLRFERFEVND